MVCHKDIKPENIIIDYRSEHDFGLKLIDFNVSQTVKDDTFAMFSHTGTEAFMAPEMLENKQFNEKIDIWGAGCILCFLLTGKMPANGYQNLSEYTLQGKYEFIRLDLNLRLQSLEEGARDLLKGLLAQKKEDRLSAKSALLHPWL